MNKKKYLRKNEQKVFTNTEKCGTILQRLAKSKKCRDIIPYDQVKNVLQSYDLLNEDKYERVLPDNGNAEYANEGAFANCPDEPDLFYFVTEGYEFIEKETGSHITVIFVNQIDYTGKWGSLTGDFLYNGEAKDIIKEDAIIEQFGIKIQVHTAFNSLEQLQKRIQVINLLDKDDPNKKFIKRDTRTEDEKDNEWKTTNHW